MAASAAVSVIARSWRGHRSECRGSQRPSSENGSVPGADTTTTKSKKASTLPPLSGIPVMEDDRHSRGISFGTRIKDFFRSTVRRQLRVSTSSSLSPSRYGGDSSSGTKLRSKSNSPAVKAVPKRTKPPTSRVRRTTTTRQSASTTSTGTQNGYSCSCSIEVLQESPRAGTRRTLNYNGLASSHNSVEVDSLYSRTTEQNDGAFTEGSSQGATDSLCDPWEHSTSSTCTSTSSPRLRTSSCASQCSRPAHEEDRAKPLRRRAFSSSSNNSSRVEETEHSGNHRPRSNSSRLPTPSSSKAGSPGGTLCFAPTSPSLPAATAPNDSTSTPNSRGIHIKNFRSRLPKLKSPTPQTKASSPPTSPNRPSKAFWPLKHKGKAKNQVANCGPADYNYDETISTLRYANRAKNIKNQAKINEDPKDALLRQFQKEIEMLKKQLEDGGVEYGADEGSEEESDEEEEVIGPDGQKVMRKKKKKGNVSKERMAAIQRQIEADRKKLEEKKDMEEEEKRKVEEDLKKKEDQLKKAQDEQDVLNNKLAALEKKIIVGGENLLEKAEEQERMLEESAKELEDRLKKEEELKKALQEKEQERLDIEEKYSTLQEEVAGKTKKLKKVWTMLMQAKSEIADLQQEHQREMEGLLENVRQLSRELHLQMLIIDQFIPPEYQEMIEQYVHWNEDIGEWQLKCVAYTGNNMRKQTPQPDKDKDKFAEPDLSHVYLAYTAEGAEEAMRPKTSKGKKSGRPKTSKSERPKTSKKKRRENDMDDQ